MRLKDLMYSNNQISIGGHHRKDLANEEYCLYFSCSEIVHRPDVIRLFFYNFFDFPFCNIDESEIVVC